MFWWGSAAGKILCGRYILSPARLYTQRVSQPVREKLVIHLKAWSASRWTPHDEQLEMNPSIRSPRDRRAPRDRHASQDIQAPQDEHLKTVEIAEYVETAEYVKNAKPLQNEQEVLIPDTAHPRAMQILQSRLPLQHLAKLLLRFSRPQSLCWNIDVSRRFYAH